MVLLKGSRLSDVPDKAIVVRSAPMTSAQIAKGMECLVGRLNRPAEVNDGGRHHVWRARAEPGSNEGRSRSRAIDSHRQQQESRSCALETNEAPR
jgi:hypothetical protein